MFKQATVKVEVYKGTKELEKGMRKMAKRGWVVQERTTRKAMLGVMGVFTNKQIHTVTYVRPQPEVAA